MREEANLMRSQQKAAVWPYLDVTASFSYADRIRVTYTVENKGIGPALVNKIKFLENGEEISSDYTAILNLLLSTLATQGGIDEKNVNLSTRINNNAVLSPGERMTLLSLLVDRYTEDQEAIVQFFRSHSFSICYSSIYEDSWMVDGTKGQPFSTERCPD